MPRTAWFGRPMDLKLELTVVDCPDAVALGSFYSRLLGWPVEEGGNDDFVTLVPPGGVVSAENPDGRPSLAFQRVPDDVAPTRPAGAHPQQLHLDFRVDDIDAAEPDVLALGATRHEHQPSERGTFRVYLDPAGHPFCLVQ